MSENEYTSTCHLVVGDKGHLWPDTKANRELDRTTRVALSGAEAAHYGKDLKKVGAAKDAEVTDDKQVTHTRTK